MKFRILFAGTALCAALDRTAGDIGRSERLSSRDDRPAYCTGGDDDVTGTGGGDVITTGEATTP